MAQVEEDRVRWLDVDAPSTSTGDSVDALIRAHGLSPCHLGRAADDVDRERYQTVYAAKTAQSRRRRGFTSRPNCCRISRNAALESRG